MKISIKTLRRKGKTNNALKTSLEKKDANLAAQIASIKAAKSNVAKRQVAQQDTLNKAAAQVQNTKQVQNTTSNDDSSNSSTSAPSSSANVGSAITAGYKYIGNSTYVLGWRKNSIRYC